MILGYGIIAIPTGIVSAEMTRQEKRSLPTNTQSCPNCATQNHRDDAEFCHHCGQKLNGE